MVTQKLPFIGADQEEIYTNIIQCNYDKKILRESIIDKKLDKSLLDIIEKLLVFDPLKRLGVLNINELKSHDFFKSIKVLI